MSDIGETGGGIAAAGSVKRRRTIADLPPAPEKAESGSGLSAGALKMLRILAITVTAVGAGWATGTLMGGASAQSATSDDVVRQALAERLPRTKVDSVSCGRLPGLCEVNAGNLLFYTDAKGRYLVVGRVYDMETRSDLTASRLLELRPDLLLAGAAGSESAGGARKGGQQRSNVEPTSRVDLSALPSKGAIHWGPKTGEKVVLFSDFRCGYCQKLAAELRGMNVRVEERPISVLGSRKLSEAVYCAKDQLKAHDLAYAGSEAAVEQRQDCSPSDLDGNEAFARRNGFNGTPVLVRADGTVLVGYKPASELSAWIKASAGRVARG